MQNLWEKLLGSKEKMYLKTETRKRKKKKITSTEKKEILKS